MPEPVRVLVPALVLVAAFVLAPAPAAQAPEQEAAGETQELDAQERRRLAKERRIEEYLRRKEEQRARREQREFSEQNVDDAMARVRGDGPAAAAPVERVTTDRASRARRSSLPRGLARAQESVRGSSLGSDPTVLLYVERVESQEASAHELAAFANFLAQSGLVAEALEYYDVAVYLEPEDSVLWTNVGTLHRQLGDTGAAMKAFQKALSVDSNNAMAHYNIGALLDEQGRYEAALEAYRVALLLDPLLGDPAVNPQAAHNERLLAVKLMLYQQQAGSLGLPLIEIPVDGGTRDE